MDNIDRELEELLSGVNNEKEKAEIIKTFFGNKIAELKNRVTEMSDDDLDLIAGGRDPIGDIYGECNSYKKKCEAAAYGIGIDICSLYTCEN